MKGSKTTDLGVITIDPEVIAKYAGTVAVECFGIVGMAAVSVKDGLVKLLNNIGLKMLVTNFLLLQMLAQ